MFYYNIIFLMSCLTVITNSLLHNKNNIIKKLTRTNKICAFSKKSRSKTDKENVDKLLINKNVVYTKNQQLYIDALNDPNVVLVVVMGSAGTGKTFIGCQWGLNEFLINSNNNNNQITGPSIKKIVITRPLIPVSGEEIGFIPGGIVNKMEPWTRPIYDAFLEKETINKKLLDKYIYDGNIEIIPLAFMRGRTFANSFIFADEMQNSTPEQMLMLLTRIGNNSKIVISGDLAQSDIKKGLTINGLYDFINKLKQWNRNGMNDDSIKIIEFDKEDIRRSKITSIVLDIYKNSE